VVLRDNLYLSNTVPRSPTLRMTSESSCMIRWDNGGSTFARGLQEAEHLRHGIDVRRPYRSFGNRRVYDLLRSPLVRWASSQCARSRGSSRDCASSSSSSLRSLPSPSPIQIWTWGSEAQNTLRTRLAQAVQNTLTQHEKARHDTKQGVSYRPRGKF
jgi:hypothetical protein